MIWIRPFGKYLFLLSAQFVKLNIVLAKVHGWTNAKIRSWSMLGQTNHVKNNCILQKGWQVCNGILPLHDLKKSLLIAGPTWPRLLESISQFGNVQTFKCVMSSCVLLNINSIMLVNLFSICYFSLISVVVYCSLIALSAVVSLKLYNYVTVTYLKKETPNPLTKVAYQLRRRPNSEFLTMMACKMKDLDTEEATDLLATEMRPMPKRHSL